MTDQVGALLSEENLLPGSMSVPSDKDLIVQVDGGHIPIQEKDKRSFEACLRSRIVIVSKKLRNIIARL